MRSGKGKTGVPFLRIIYNFIYNRTYTFLQSRYFVNNSQSAKYTLFSVYIQKICTIPSDILYTYTKKCTFNCTYCLLNIVRTIKYTLFHDLYTILFTIRWDPCSHLSMRLLSGKAVKNNRIDRISANLVVTVSHWLTVVYRGFFF